MTERIDHAAEANRILAQWASPNDPHGWAQVHATLALAEQQRIANLIALGHKYYGYNEDVENAYINLLRPEIRQALGLND